MILPFRIGPDGEVGEQYASAAAHAETHLEYMQYAIAVHDHQARHGVVRPRVAVQQAAPQLCGRQRGRRMASAAAMNQGRSST